MPSRLQALSLYSEFQRAIVNGNRKRSLYWLGHLDANYQRVGQRILKTVLIYLQKKLSISHPAREISFQVVAGETKLFMRSSSTIFQNVSPSGSRWDWLFGECFQKKSLPVVAAENAIFRTALLKNCKKIILPKLDRIFKTNFPASCREYKTHFRPSWLEVGFDLYAICREVMQITSTQAV